MRVRNTCAFAAADTHAFAAADTRAFAAAETRAFAAADTWRTKRRSRGDTHVFAPANTRAFAAVDTRALCAADTRALGVACMCAASLCACAGAFEWALPYVRRAMRALWRSPLAGAPASPLAFTARERLYRRFVYVQAGGHTIDTASGSEHTSVVHVARRTHIYTYMYTSGHVNWRTHAGS